MIYLIVRSILPFLLIVVFFIFSASLLFYSIFYEEEAFKSLEMSIRTIFDFSIGNVNFSVFQNDTGIGMWLTILWVFVSTITMLNILIAILSYKFDDIIRSTDAYYISLLYDIWVYNRYVPNYGAFSSLPCPLNSLLLIIFPIYLLDKQ